MDLAFNFQRLVVPFYVAFATSIAVVLVKGWKVRRLFYKLRKQGLVFRPLSTIDTVNLFFYKPMPPWNPITGHLLAIAPYVQLFPWDAHQTYTISELAKRFPTSDNAFYLDVWPFSMPLLVVTSAELAIQACQTYDLPKPAALKPFFLPFAGGDNLFVTNGAEWKKSRSLFNPGFNANYLLGQMSHIVEETSVFVDILREHATEGDIFSLDTLTCDFTMDIIGAVSMNSRLLFQRKFNQLASAMRSQVLWHCPDNELNPLVRWNPVRPIMQWYNSRQMSNYISTELDKRFVARLGQKDAPSKSIIDLVLDDYINENPSRNASQGIDAAFKKWATVQIRLFLFAGHDSTASTICYCYHLLWKHPEALARIHAEHDEVFGTDLSTVVSQLLTEPNKINLLPYTTAVLKEVMRLFPAAAGMRGGLPGVELQTTNDVRLPTEGLNIWVLHISLQRNPKYWPEPDRFMPERWLVGPDDPLYPVKGAFRPFEFGPRNCMGQTLVMQDVKATLAMTLREFNIRAAYEEWDELHPRKGLKMAWGERAYQVFAGAAHPADGFPCKVSFRE